MPQARVHVIPTAAPDDVAGLMTRVRAGRIAPAGIVAVIGKTEGNGCVNDFTRAFAVCALKAALSPLTDVSKIAFVMSGGTEGAISPHLIVLEKAEGNGPSPALAIGCAVTEDLPGAGLGRIAQIEMVADGVRAAMASAGITDPADVHFVQIKCPLLTAERIAQVESSGDTAITRDTLKSMGFSRGAAALGVALALGEAAPDRIRAANVTTDPDLWSARASTSAGIEVLGHEIVVLGMSERWQGDLAIDHAVMADAIDLGPVRAALNRLSCDPSAVVAVIAKAEASSNGQVRGQRHTMLDDSDISATRHARAFVAGALSGLFGRTNIYVSGGAEHQGPDGGGPVAIIARKQERAGHDRAV